MERNIGFWLAGRSRGYAASQVLRLSKEVILRRVGIAAGVALVCGACSLVTSLQATRIGRLDEPAVRAFAASQESAWNAHDFDRFYSTVAPDAVFTSVR